MNAGHPLRHLSLSADPNNAEFLLGLTDRIGTSFPHQRGAVEKVVDLLLAFVTGNLGRDRLPNILLFGQGAGKVAFVKELVGHAYGNLDCLLHYRMRNDMSLSEPVPALLRNVTGQNSIEAMRRRPSSHAVYRLFGAPRGYEGTDAGELSEAIRSRPGRVVLFEGIEDAHQCVRDRMRPILEDGVSHDGDGRELDFRNAWVFMTSELNTQQDLTATLTPAWMNVVSQRISFA